jgi:probable rRNA maturation factor
VINYEINQTVIPPLHRLKKPWLTHFFQIMNSYLRLRKSYTVSIAFIDGRTMRRLNREYRGKDKVTDILSFAGEGDDLGELLLAWPYVQKQARKNSVSLEEELTRLLVHGSLHLRGFDHETKPDAAKMLPLQEKIFESLWSSNGQQATSNEDLKTHSVNIF